MLHTTEWKHFPTAIAFCRNFRKLHLFYEKRTETKLQFSLFFSSGLFPSGVTAANRLPRSESDFHAPAMTQHSWCPVALLHQPTSSLDVNRKVKICSLLLPGSLCSASLFLSSSLKHSHILPPPQPTADEVVCGRRHVNHPPTSAAIAPPSFWKQQCACAGKRGSGRAMIASVQLNRSDDADCAGVPAESSRRPLRETL